MALPAREDGPAHHRDPARHRGQRRRGVPARPRSISRCSPISGPSAPSCRWTPPSLYRLPQRPRGALLAASGCRTGCCSPATRTRPGPTAASTAQAEAWLDAAALRGRQVGAARSPRPSGSAQGFARLLGDPGGGIALAANTHELVVRLLSALPLRARPRLVTTDGEFHTIRRQLDRLAEEGLERRAGAGGAARVAGRAAGGGGGRPHRRWCWSRPVFFDTGRIARGLDRGGGELPAPREPRCWWTPTTRSTWCRSRWPRGPGGRLRRGRRLQVLPAGRGELLPAASARTATLRPVITGWFSEFTALADREHPERVAYGTGGDRFAGATYDPTSHYRAVRGLRLLSRAGAHARAAAPGEPAPDRAARRRVRRARSRSRRREPRPRLSRSRRSAASSRSARRPRRCWPSGWPRAACAATRAGTCCGWARPPISPRSSCTMP